MVEAPIFIDDNPLLSTNEIGDQIELQLNTNKIGLIIIDGLNYVTSNSDSLGQDLRLMSRKFHLPIIASIQLQEKKTIDKRPHLHDLDFAGRLRNEADIILFLHKYTREYFDYSEIILAKHKDGPLGKIDVKFLPEYSCFESVVDRV